MKVHFLLVGAVSIGLLISAPDSDAHGGGGGGGGGRGGAMFHAGGFRGRGGVVFRGGRFAGFRGRGRFFGPGFGFYGYGYPWWWGGWGYGYYPGWYYGDYGYYPGSYYGDDPSYGGRSDDNQDPQFSSTRAVQAALAWRGYYSGRIDGVMGPETREAIRSFQAHQGLPVTGQIDHGSINALRR